jgi:hypothetical protein
MKNTKTLFLSAAMFCIMPLSAQNNSSDALYNSFLNPPKEAAPRVWWHWMNGNITKDGIRKDLLWMHRSGVAGFHVFDGQLAMRQIVKRVAFMSPEWKDAFHSAIALGDSLGMEMTIASSPGWSETGGPWVEPKDGMKRLEWRHIDVTGGKKLHITLPTGYNNLGVFQDNHYDDSFEVLKNVAKIRYYKDIAVLAVRMPDEYKTLAEMSPIITTSGGNVTTEQLTDDNINDYSVITRDAEGNCWIQFEFSEAQTIRSFSFSETREKGGGNNIINEILCSNDGKTFTKVDSINSQDCIQQTHNIPATTARFFRFCLKNSNGTAADNYKISMLVPSTLNIVESFSDKTAFTINSSINDIITPETSLSINKNSVLDITKYVKNGILTWNAPSGKWRILRMGYGLTGKANHPAVVEGTGLEVDKIDPEAVERYYKNLLKLYTDASQGLIGKKGITYVLNDSYEAGLFTWTANMMNEFKKRRGYDLKQWLPALTGIIVNSSDETDRFLFDWRTTLSEMMTDYSYDLETKILSRYNLKRYSEAHGGGRANVSDGMDDKRSSAIPMSEFWAHYKQGWIQKPGEDADIRESASVAHIFGQNLNAAESFSCDGFNEGAFVYRPENLKRAADLAFSSGLNRIVVHESALQPVDDKFPGIGLGRWGQWFNRHETWAEQASAWTKYLSRSSYMLQQGHFVADIAVYYGEDNNAAGVFNKQMPDVPAGFNFDYINKYILQNIVSTDNGCLTTKTGMKYRVLYLNNVNYMSLPMLRRIGEIADAGVTLCGGKPERMANLNGDTNEFKRLVDHIWNSGKKNVSNDVPIDEVLKTNDIKPDVEWLPATNDIRFVHRALTDGDIYWLSNMNDAYRTFNFSFRTTGKKPFIWHPDTGLSEPAEYLIQGDRTNVKVSFVPHDAVFVVFNEPTTEMRGTVKSTYETQVAKITTPWKVAFQENRGAPADTTMAQLSSLTESKNDGIKYFSGTATYTTTFSWSGTPATGKADKYYLDLGEVHDLAEVTLNGHSLGVIWHTPFRADVTSILQSGDNTLEVKAVNVWHNRFIGDLQPGVKNKIAFYSKNFFTPDEPLLPAGLVGPVSIVGIY